MIFSPTDHPTFYIYWISWLYSQLVVSPRDEAENIMVSIMAIYKTNDYSCGFKVGKHTIPGGGTTSLGAYTLWTDNSN